MSVHIDYWLEGEGSPCGLDVAPTDFFDLDEGEIPGLGSVPKHDHAFAYITEEPSRVVSTVLQIRDSGAGNRITIRETYWNQRRNCIIERKDEQQGATTYVETIHDIVVSEYPECRRITRIGWHGEKPIVYSDARLVKKQDGTEEEEILYREP